MSSVTGRRNFTVGRTRHEYRLTAKGLDLQPVLVAVARWGDRYLADPEGPPVDVVHRDGGAPLQPALECAEGHRVTDPREVVTVPGPGAKPFAGQGLPTRPGSRPTP